MASTPLPHDHSPAHVETRHPPFSPRASIRETGAFVGGLVALVGAFGPWLHITGTRAPPMGAATPFTETLWGGLAGGPVAAILCAFALAASLAPLNARVRLGLRLGLFALAAATVAGAVAFHVFGNAMTVFQELDSVRPAWGLVLALGGSLTAAGLTLSRLLERRRAAAA